MSDLCVSNIGVELADKLSTRLRLQTNGEQLSAARRSKALMQDEIAAAGLRSIRHKLVYSPEEVQAFYSILAKTEEAKCIVKPNKSSGSDGVSLCKNLSEALAAFNRISERRNAFGSTNHGVLMEEFIQGKEYVVDGVSLNGKYKVTAIWRYDKQNANGADFVYFGMFLVDPATPAAQALVNYASSVVDCLGIRNGPSHMELMLDSIGPCLIEGKTSVGISFASLAKQLAAIASTHKLTHFVTYSWVSLSWRIGK